MGEVQAVPAEQVALRVLPVEPARRALPGLQAHLAREVVAVRRVRAAHQEPGELRELVEAVVVEVRVEPRAPTGLPEAVEPRAPTVHQVRAERAEVLELQESPGPVEHPVLVEQMEQVEPPEPVARVEAPAPAVCPVRAEPRV